MHTPDIVLECAGKIPPGSFARGYYDLHGDSPIGPGLDQAALAAVQGAAPFPAPSPR